MRYVYILKERTAIRYLDTRLYTVKRMADHLFPDLHPIVWYDRSDLGRYVASDDVYILRYTLEHIYD